MSDSFQSPCFLDRHFFKVSQVKSPFCDALCHPSNTKQHFTAVDQSGACSIHLSAPSPFLSPSVSTHLHFRFSETRVKQAQKRIKEVENRPIHTARGAKMDRKK